MSLNLTLLGQMITFVLFVWITMRFVWPPIVKAMDERKKKIADGLAAARAGEDKLTQADVEAKNITDQARADAKTIIESARAQGKDLVATAKTDAQAQADSITAQAQKDVAAQKAKLQNDIEVAAVNLTVDLSQKFLLKKLDKAANVKVVEKLLEATHA
jgi:F-type H+-transporting ATPase subunit b